jgi:hypothetical protein
MELGADYKITREPHTNPKTGAVKHGWLLGHKKTPLYGAPTESLIVPATGWKKFNGEAPPPKVQTHEQLTDLFFAMADDAKTEADAAAEKEDWLAARSSLNAGIEALKRSGERFGDPFKNRAALLLSRRANSSAKLQDYRSCLRDSIAALELVRSLASAEALAVEAAKELGCGDEAAAQKMLEPVGAGRILDSGAPLVLRCVERWIEDVVATMQAAKDSKSTNLEIPAPTHLASDRYLDGLDEKTREEIIKKYLPDLFKPPGGTGMLKNATECKDLMLEWEQVFKSKEFQDKRKALWDKHLSYTIRLRDTRTMVAESLKEVLEPRGFAPGKPGLSRVIKQMQVYWSADKPCAAKALDLEELADVSLADLET